ncbi:MAG TPA: ABC transporter permease, partial [Bryobacteraceae bacterium]|nr:ABC transporter permease [Bryobacteraceae bacterium]
MVLLNGLSSDLRHSLRGFRASPGFATVAILSLGLGIGANTAIFSLIDAVLLKTLPVQRPDQLVQLSMGANGGTFTNPIWEQVRDRQDVFSGAFAYAPARFNLVNGGEVNYAQGLWASGDYFSTLGVTAILGRTFAPADDRRGCAGEAILTHHFWQSHYGGNPDVLSKTISLDGHSFPIVGVTQPGFTGVDVGFRADVIVPVCTEPMFHTDRSALDNRSWWWLRVIARPKSAVSGQQALARMNVLAPEIFSATTPQNWRNEYQANYRKRTFAFKPAANGLSFLRSEYSLALWTLMGVVGAVLLIACANVANLLLARAAARRHEMAIRLAIGAPRGRLLRQLLLESLMLAAAGAALGVVFAEWGSRLLVGFLSDRGSAVFLNLTPDLRVLGFTIAIALATGILFGLAPAWRGSRVPAQAAMKESARGIVDGRSRFGMGKILVIGQVALSLVLLVAAGLMVGTFRTLATLNPGFNRDQVLLVHADARNLGAPKQRLAAEFDQMTDRLRAVPGVAAASESNMTPISGSFWNEELVIDGFQPKDPDDGVAWFNAVGPNYFETMGISPAGGRDFTPGDSASATHVAIVNETMAKHFFGKSSPIGRIYRTREGRDLGAPVEIVGVVKDAKYGDLREDTKPAAFVPLEQADPATEVNFELRAAVGVSPSSLIPGLKAALAENHARVNLEFHTLAVQLAESLNRERLLATLSGFFGALALMLAAIGLYGVMSYSVARRRNEIGIRMALGAQRSRVMNMVLGEVTLLIGIGLIAGTAAALASTRLVASFLYGLRPRDPMTIVIAAAILTAVAILAGYLPARR